MDPTRRGVVLQTTRMKAVELAASAFGATTL
jgi:hypothetical protein